MSTVCLLHEVTINGTSAEFVPLREGRDDNGLAEAHVEHLVHARRALAHRREHLADHVCNLARSHLGHRRRLLFSTSVALGAAVGARSLNFSFVRGSRGWLLLRSGVGIAVCGGVAVCARPLARLLRSRAQEGRAPIASNAYLCIVRLVCCAWPGNSNAHMASPLKRTINTSTQTHNQHDAFRVSPNAQSTYTINMTILAHSPVASVFEDT